MTGHGGGFFHHCGLAPYLEELGVESQFDYGWGYDIPEHPDKLILMNRYSVPNLEDTQQVYHFSDLLLPENAKKVWGEKMRDIMIRDKFINIELWKGAQYKLVSKIRNGEDWQSWLMSELDKRV